MDNLFESTSLWQHTLSEQSPFSKEYPNQVERLRTIYREARKNVKDIASGILKEQPNLTIHDITHIDALWETASLIIRPSSFNPIEGFIFGCCCLFHDLGLSLAYQEENLNTMLESSEFKDLLFQVSNDIEKQQLLESSFNLSVVSEKSKRAAFQIRARQIHAFEARKLPLKQWDLNGNPLYVIPDQEIRKFLGDRIGVLSESHWWSCKRILEEFRDNVESISPIGFPQNWKINNVRIASIFRIADYIQIDYRRAPDLIYSMMDLEPLSKLHWKFQNKLNRVFLKENNLIFESLEDFTYDEIDAWWLAHNTILSIHEEIGEVNNLLSSLSLEKLQCNGVLGAENAELLSKFIKPSGWAPVDTRYKVSNIKLIIERFGGEALYGKNHFIAIRELLQNSMDAIKAAEQLGKVSDNQIEVSLNDTDGRTYLTIKDGGVGLSRHSIINYLLDFGKSYWISPDLSRDFPGLASSGFKPTGKYGIGFFSIFMISSKIKLITTHITTNEKWILEFIDGPETPPILRRPQPDEELIQSGTKIVMEVSNNGFLNQIISEMKLPLLNGLDSEEKLIAILRNLIPLSPVKVTASFNHSTPKLVCAAEDWISISTSEFLDRIVGRVDSQTILDTLKTLRESENDISQNVETNEDEGEKIDDVLREKNAIAHNLSLVERKGSAIGIATIIDIDYGSNQLDANDLIFFRPWRGSRSRKYSDLIKSRRAMRGLNPFSTIRKGIVTVDGLFENYGFQIPGVWKGANEKLDRSSAKLELQSEEIIDWVEEQGKLVTTNPFLSEGKKYVALGQLFNMGLKYGDAPLLRIGESSFSCNQFLNYCKKQDYLVFTFYSNEETRADGWYTEPIYIRTTVGSNYHRNEMESAKEISKYAIEGFSGLSSKALASTEVESSIDFDKSYYRKFLRLVFEAWNITPKSNDVLRLIDKSYLKNPLFSLPQNPDDDLVICCILVNPNSNTDVKIAELEDGSLALNPQEMSKVNLRRRLTNLTGMEGNNNAN